MKLTYILIVFSACFLAIQAQEPANPIDWHSVEPIAQVPGFWDSFPLLRFILQLFSHNFDLSYGNRTERDSFPHMVGIVVNLDRGNGFCSGAVLSPNCIMTAAHCVYSAYSGILITGAHNIRNGTEDGQRRYVFEQSNIVIHPNYFPDSIQHDVALIKGVMLTLSDFVQPIRLPTRRQAGATWQNQLTTLSGWGRSLFDFAETLIRDDPRFIEGTVLSRARCNLAFPTMIGPDQMCTQSEEFIGACPGDSGGGLTVVEADGNRTLVGIVNMISAVGCEGGRPTVYTNIASYSTWVEREAGIPVRED